MVSTPFQINNTIVSTPFKIQNITEGTDVITPPTPTDTALENIKFTEKKAEETTEEIREKKGTEIERVRDKETTASPIETTPQSTKPFEMTFEREETTMMKTEELTTEKKETSTKPFYTTNSQVSSWGVWSECDAQCNSGSKTRARVCLGRCEDMVVQERRVCNTKPCPSPDCPMNAQFRCTDYSRRCISYQYVCDGLADCPGLSDETSCIDESHVVVDPVYQVGKIGGKVLYSVILYNEDKKRVEKVVWSYIAEEKPVPITTSEIFFGKYRFTKAYLRLTLTDLVVDMSGDFTVTIKFSDGTIKSSRITLLVLQNNTPKTTERQNVIENEVEEPTNQEPPRQYNPTNETFHANPSNRKQPKSKKECGLDCTEQVSEDCTRCICGIRVLFIYITAQNDDKVEGASVFVGPHGVARIAQSNRDGWVMLTGLCEGDSNLIIHKDGYEDYYLNGVSVQRAGYSAIMVAMKKKTRYVTPPNTPAQLWRGMFHVKNMKWERSLTETTTLEYQGLYQLFLKHLAKLYTGYMVKVRDIYFMDPAQYQYSQRLSAFRRGGGDNSKISELTKGMIVRFQMVVIPGQDTEVLKAITQRMITSGKLSESIEVLTDWMRFFQVNVGSETELPTEPVTIAKQTQVIACINDWGDDNCQWFKDNHGGRFREWCKAYQSKTKCRKMCGNCVGVIDLTEKAATTLPIEVVTDYFIGENPTTEQIKEAATKQLENPSRKTEKMVKERRTKEVREDQDTETGVMSSSTMPDPGPDNLEFNRVTANTQANTEDIQGTIQPEISIQTEKTEKDLASPEQEGNEVETTQETFFTSSQSDTISDTEDCDPCDSINISTTHESEENDTTQENEQNATTADKNVVLTTINTVTSVMEESSTTKPVNITPVLCGANGCNPVTTTEVPTIEIKSRGANTADDIITASGEGTESETTKQIATENETTEEMITEDITTKSISTNKQTTIPDATTTQGVVCTNCGYKHTTPPKTTRPTTTTNGIIYDYTTAEEDITTEEEGRTTTNNEQQITTENLTTEDTIVSTELKTVEQKVTDKVKTSYLFITEEKTEQEERTTTQEGIEPTDELTAEQEGSETEAILTNESRELTDDGLMTEDAVEGGTTEESRVPSEKRTEKPDTPKAPTTEGLSTSREETSEHLVTTEESAIPSTTESDDIQYKNGTASDLFKTNSVTPTMSQTGNTNNVTNNVTEERITEPYSEPYSIFSDDSSSTEAKAVPATTEEYTTASVFVETEDHTQETDKISTGDNSSINHTATNSHGNATSKWRESKATDVATSEPLTRKSSIGYVTTDEAKTVDARITARESLTKPRDFPSTKPDDTSEPPTRKYSLEPEVTTIEGRVVSEITPENTTAGKNITSKITEDIPISEVEAMSMEAEKRAETMTKENKYTTEHEEKSLTVATTDKDSEGQPTEPLASPKQEVTIRTDHITTGQVTGSIKKNTAQRSATQNTDTPDKVKSTEPKKILTENEDTEAAEIKTEQITVGIELEESTDVTTEEYIRSASNIFTGMFTDGTAEVSQRSNVEQEAKTDEITDKSASGAETPTAQISDSVEEVTVERMILTSGKFIRVTSENDRTEDHTTSFSSEPREGAGSEAEVLLTFEATTEPQEDVTTGCPLRCMSGSSPTALCDSCVCNRGRNYTVQIRDYNRNPISGAVAKSQVDDVLGRSDNEGYINIINTCYTQVTVQKYPVYKSQGLVLRYSKSRPVLSVYLESNRDARCPVASFDCLKAADPECFRDSDCQEVNGKCCMSDCTHKCVGDEHLQITS